MSFSRKLAVLLCSTCLAVSATAQTVNSLSTNNIAFNFASFFQNPNVVSSVTLENIDTVVYSNTIYPPYQKTLSRANYPQLTNGTAIFSNVLCGAALKLTVSTFYSVLVTNVCVPSTGFDTNADGNARGELYLGTYQRGLAPTFNYSSLSGFRFQTNVLNITNSVIVYATNYINLTNAFTFPETNWPSVTNGGIAMPFDLSLGAHLNAAQLSGVIPSGSMPLITISGDLSGSGTTGIALSTNAQFQIDVLSLLNGGSTAFLTNYSPSSPGAQVTISNNLTGPMVSSLGGAMTNQIGNTIAPANVLANLMGAYSGMYYTWNNFYIVNTNQFIYAADVGACYRPYDKSWNMWFIGGTNEDTTTYPPQLYYKQSFDWGLTWSVPVSVMTVNSTPNQWNSGTINSVRVFYDPATDINRLTISGTTNSSGFVFGAGNVLPRAIGQVGIVQTVSNANWALSASYPYINGGLPVLTNGLSAYETNGGVYCATLLRTPLLSPTNWTLLYTCNSNFGNAQCFAASSPDLTNWTKGSSPIIFGAEELNIIPTSDGTFLASAYSFGGNAITLSGVTYSSIWRSRDPNGVSGWYNDSYMQMNLYTNIYTAFVGKGIDPAYGTYIQNPDGTLLYVYSSLQNSTRSYIASAKVTMEPPHGIFKSDSISTKGIYVGNTNNFNQVQGGAGVAFIGGVPVVYLDTNVVLVSGQTPSDAAQFEQNGVNTFGGATTFGNRSYAIADMGCSGALNNGLSGIGMAHNNDGVTRIGATAGFGIWDNSTVWTKANPKAKGDALSTASFSVKGTTTTVSNVVVNTAIIVHTNSAPSNTTTPLFWMSVTNMDNGQSYRIPMYQ